MDEQTFKKLLYEALDPIKSEVGSLKGNVSSLKEDVTSLKEDVSSLKESVLNIEQVMTSYADSYKINQHNIERLDTRLTTVEENFGVDVPEDLKVPHFVIK